ncbi:MAG: prepilin-type N-terminal cleavage/methylation domain-containing protein [Peptostreptococcaceae bacterium]
MLTNKNIKSRKCKKGFTLLEVIIAFALISIFIIPISNLVLSSVKINKQTENKQQAKAVLQDMVEDIKAIEDLSTAIINPLNKVETVGEDGKLYYSLSGDINRFSIEGFIKEESLVIDNKTNEKEIARAIYFDGDSISVSSGASTIEKAISKFEGSLDIFGDEVSIAMTEAGGISIIYGDSNSAINIATPEYSALILCINRKTHDVNKLKLNIENNYDTEKLKVYLYNDDKVSEREDIIISTLKGEIELITGIQNDDHSKNQKLYSVELKAKKDNEVIETISFDLVK